MKFKIYAGVKFTSRYAVSYIVASQIMRCCRIKVLHARCYRSGAICRAAPFCDPFAPYLLRSVTRVAVAVRDFASSYILEL
ncbi:hypothetical protein CAMGR0001_1570 [Campylobacter gracilis RM3268]|uniref:Uncharacterized protein n=1 Tax=Campylobacter gracilis RM3268 TaxID=553220 RepID=C8PK19_9BACT|nr:hypothetical protein CAMGR0001_1570 [Campylobacter gracilis RM3268]